MQSRAKNTNLFIGILLEKTTRKIDEGEVFKGAFLLDQEASPTSYSVVILRKLAATHKVGITFLIESMSLVWPFPCKCLIQLSLLVAIQLQPKVNMRKMCPLQKNMGFSMHLNPYHIYNMFLPYGKFPFLVLEAKILQLKVDVILFNDILGEE